MKTNRIKELREIATVQTGHDLSGIVIECLNAIEALQAENTELINKWNVRKAEIDSAEIMNKKLSGIISDLQVFTDTRKTEIGELVRAAKKALIECDCAVEEGTFVPAIANECTNGKCWHKRLKNSLIPFDGEFE